MRKQTTNEKPGNFILAKYRLNIQDRAKLNGCYRLHYVQYGLE